MASIEKENQGPCPHCGAVDDEHAWVCHCGGQNGHDWDCPVTIATEQAEEEAELLRQLDPDNHPP